MKIRNILAIIAGVILIIVAIVENTIHFSWPKPVSYVYGICLCILFVYIVIVLILILVNKCVPSLEKPKCKYEPLKINFDDIMIWLEKANVPETLYLKGKTVEYIQLEVQFATIGKNGSFVDKGFYLNDKELSLESIKEELTEALFIEEGNCILLEITEHNDPKLFLKVLKELKNNSVNEE
ncbi:MAG: hypothetical protein K2J93_02830 [Anaeroplasmataceae bacterium]|nr:hypothetical protein [Anaeroplasmataceae bacterium]